MNTDLFTGCLVRLTAYRPEADSEIMAKWSLDSEFLRLIDSEPAMPWTARQIKEEQVKEEQNEPKPTVFDFVIRTLAEDRPIGFIALRGIRWNHGDTWLSVGIGDRTYWGKGYGSDALLLVLRYAFTELNLHRVSLSVLDRNVRAIRSYEKSGFVIEGRMRQFTRRDGQVEDLLYMGILREEWERLQP